MIKRFRKKPVVIEAIEYTGENGFEILHWMEENSATREVTNLNDTLVIKTLEGDMTASKGDFIIKGIGGEFYPCKPLIFEQTYEEEKN